MAGSDTPAWSGGHGSDVLDLAFAPDQPHLLAIGWHRVFRVDFASPAVADDSFHTPFGTRAVSADGRAVVGQTVPSLLQAASNRRLTIRLARHGPDGWAEAWRVEAGYDPAAEGAGYQRLLLDPAGTRVIRVQRRYVARKIDEYAFRSFDAAGRSTGEWVGGLPSSSVQRVVGPDGRLVHLYSRAFYAVALDRPGSEPVKRLNTSPKHFTGAAFSPDGRWLATTSNDTLVTVWDTATWQPARRYEWTIGRLRSVAFSPDGALCAAGSDTGRVVVWDFDG